MGKGRLVHACPMATQVLVSALLRISLLLPAPRACWCRGLSQPAVLLAMWLRRRYCWQRPEEGSCLHNVCHKPVPKQPFFQTWLLPVLVVP